MEYGLSLGSNLENRIDNIRSASDMIDDIDGVSISEQASIYETAPVGISPEYEHLLFLNTILIIETKLLPATLHKELVKIEIELGRVRNSEQNSPRTIDIDIIYADHAISNTETLILPHPRWAERRFVVAPLAEVRPDLIIDSAKGTVKDILLSLPLEPRVVLFAR